MVDALVSTIIQQLTTILQNEIEQEVRLVVGVRKEVEKLKRSFRKIQTVLNDVEKRQFMGGSEVVDWLQDLKDVAYEIDDVLDEWSTAILKSQLEQGRSRVDDDTDHTSSSNTSKKVCPGNLFSPPSCCFSLKQVGLRRDIGRKIKEINERIDEIASLQKKFDFVPKTDTSRNLEIMQKESKRKLETSAFIDASEVFGRDKDKDKIISKLLGEDSGSQQQQLAVSTKTIPVISIEGMGGLGKTTLAQFVFNDDKVKKHFEKRVWVHVGSKPFDKMKVANDIIRQIGGKGDSIYQGGDNSNYTLHYMHDQLNKSVDAKHFLLVLDDVWNEDPIEWDPLRQSLGRGSQESRIIVTTRNEGVANMMDATYVHRLDILPDEVCWSLLRHYAFIGRQEEQCEKLERIGRELAKKCKGLPLSARTLGGVLHSKTSRQDWQNVLNSDLWAVLSIGDKRFLPSLLISYNDFPSHLKQCFTYCSVLPRGYSMTKVSIIQMWMAQGFLGDHRGPSSTDFFKVGEEYCNHLVMRSFFQRSGKIAQYEFYKMHDLVYDFAKSLEENACFSLTIRADTISAYQELNVTGARHLSLQVEGMNTIPSFICKEKNLRTFIVYGWIPKVSSNLLCHLMCLRTLDLSDTYLEELPNEIEKLIHLRSLMLTNARFEKLPKSVTSLYNLQTLWLGGCSNLRKLPEGIGGMINLVDVELTGCRQLSYLPRGIGRLIKLRRLTYFIIGGGGVKRGGCKIAELKHLNFLHDTLSIIGLGIVENESEAETACLKNKQHLRGLYFYFDQFTGVSRVDEDVVDEEAEGEGEEKVEGEQVDGEGKTEEKIQEKRDEEEDNTLWRRMEDVLEGLKPHPNIEKISINDYPGVVFPNWIASPTECINFSNIVFFELRNCRKCKQLPSTLGKLPSLETLVIDGMNQVKFMGVEFFGIADDDDDDGVDTIVFPKLKVFQLSDMPNLEEWDVRVQVKEDEENKAAAAAGFIFMPCLQYLFVGGLPKLRSIPRHLTQATSLRKLFIWYCPNLTWMLPSPSHSHLLPPPFLHVEELILKYDAGSLSKSLLLFPKLKLLRVRVSPYSSLPQGLGQLTSLEVLDIRTCSEIKSIIPQGEEEGVLQRLPALRELKIMRCPALRQSCQKEIGEDWSKISHIPKIFIDDQKIK